MFWEQVNGMKPLVRIHSPIQSNGNAQIDTISHTYAIIKL